MKHPVNNEPGYLQEYWPRDKFIDLIVVQEENKGQSFDGTGEKICELRYRKLLSLLLNQ